MKPKRVHFWQAALVLAPALQFSGCYRYGYHERSPAAGNSNVAIDEHVPLSDTRWSYFWGLLSDPPYSPKAAECDDRGAGKVVVSTPWYGVPVSLVTLGIASPAVVTLYCSTDPGPPGEGP